MGIANICMFRLMCGNTRINKVGDENIFVKVGLAHIKENVRKSVMMA